MPSASIALLSTLLEVFCGHSEFWLLLKMTPRSLTCFIIKIAQFYTTFAMKYFSPIAA